MNEISKNLRCVLLRSGIEIWAEEEKIKNLETILKGLTESKFIGIEGQTINTADISGIFSAELMAEKTRRKNGEWQDEKGVWHLQGDWKCQYKDLYHKKFEKCEHLNSLGYK